MSNKEKEEQIKWAKYRWEFMRRNPEYRKDWEEVQELRKRIVQKKGHDEFYEYSGIFFYPDPDGDEAKREREDPGGEEKGGVDKAHHHGAGPQVLGEERHHRDAHVGGDITQKPQRAADHDEEAVGVRRGGVWGGLGHDCQFLEIINN